MVDVVVDVVVLVVLVVTVVDVVDVVAFFVVEDVAGTDVDEEEDVVVVATTDNFPLLTKGIKRHLPVHEVVIRKVIWPVAYHQMPVLLVPVVCGLYPVL